MTRLYKFIRKLLPHCGNCRYWTIESFYKDFQFGYRAGDCDRLPGEKVDISIDAGWDGGCLGDIITDDTFVCGYWRRKINRQP